MRKKGGTTQAELGAMFGVDQSSVNRSLEASNEILAEVLPTARKDGPADQGGGHAKRT